MSQPNLIEEPALDQVRQEKVKEYARVGRRLTLSAWVELLMYDHPSYNHRVEHARYYSTHHTNQQSEGE